MEVDIVTAKRELYASLKKKYAEVTGAGIQEKKGSEEIVVFLSAPNKQLQAEIPSTYKGNKVVVKVQPIPRAL